MLFYNIILKAQVTSNKINNKSIARIAAIQVLYQFANKNQQQNVDLYMQNVLDLYQSGEADSSEGWKSKPIKIRPSTNCLKELVHTTVQNIDKIDNLIADHLTSEWQLSTLPILLLATLRVGVCELIFFPRTPPKVIINEFTDITSDMLNDNEVGFVNSLLDKIHKERPINHDL